LEYPEPAVGNARRTLFAANMTRDRQHGGIWKQTKGLGMNFQQARIILYAVFSLVNSESVSNEIDESDWQYEKQHEQRMRT
jgi:hypothetical protein